MLEKYYQPSLVEDKISKTWENEEDFKHEVSARGFPEEPVGTNMDIDILYDMFKKG